MINSRSGKFVRGGSIREFAGRKPSKEVASPSSPETTTPVTEHRWHGKGLQKQERLHKATLSGRANKDPANFTRKNGRGVGGWGNDDVEADLLGYDDEDVGMDEPVDSLEGYIPPEPNIQFNISDDDIIHKQLEKKTKPTLIQPESHKNPAKQYAENWLEGEEYTAYEYERKERERSRSSSPDDHSSSQSHKKHHGGVKHGKGKHARMHHLRMQSPPPISA